MPIRFFTLPLHVIMCDGTVTGRPGPDVKSAVTAHETKTKQRQVGRPDERNLNSSSSTVHRRILSLIYIWKEGRKEILLVVIHCTKI